MNILKKLCLFLCIISISLTSVSAGFFDDIIQTDSSNHPYDDNYSLDTGGEIVKDNLNGIQTDVGAAEFIQDIVVYLLGFISLIAVIYIIYSGFQILIGNGEEEKLKKSKTTIIYVILGIIVIWLAWPITTFILRMLS